MLELASDTTDIPSTMASTSTSADVNLTPALPGPEALSGGFERAAEASVCGGESVAVLAPGFRFRIVDGNTKPRSPQHTIKGK